MSVRRRFRRKFALAVTIVACSCLLVAVAAVVRSSGSSGSSEADPPAPRVQTGEQSVALLWHELAQCLRRHGHPEIADPTVSSDGRVNFASKSGDIRELLPTLGRTACPREFAALEGPPREPPPTPAELHRMVLFSRCMRDHGLGDWPDPRADGTYPLNQRLKLGGKRGILDQLAACRHVDPGGRIRTSVESEAASKRT
jgi:hypothetical protein